MTHRTRGRVAAGLAAGAVALLGTAFATVPAAAADSTDGPVVTLRNDSGSLSLPLPGDDWSDLSFAILRNSASPVKDLTLMADYSGISSFAVPNPYQHCSAGTCKQTPYTMTDKGQTGEFAFKAGPSAKIGDTGKLVVSATTPDGTVEGFTATVTVDGTKKIVVGDLTDHRTVQPDSTIGYPLYVGNDGSLPIKGAEVTLRTSNGLSIGDWSNCTTTDGGKDLRATRTTVCDFDTTLEPGQQYKLSTPLPVKVSASALNEAFSQSAKTLDTTPSVGSHPLTLVAAGDLPAGLTDTASQFVDVDSSADLAAHGSEATGKPGASVDVTVGVHNTGPGSVQQLESDDQAGFLVNIPKGTTTTAVPASCDPFKTDGPTGGKRLGRPQYVCILPEPFAAGQDVTLSFTLKIAADAPSVTTGQVKVASVYGIHPVYDKNPKNDLAPITVHVTGGKTPPPAGGTTGGSGGSGTSGGSTGTGGPGNAPGPQTTGGTGGALASTGFDGGELAGIGGALVAAGAGAFLVTRRLRGRSA